jgi:hypothetical protein
MRALRSADAVELLRIVRIPIRAVDGAVLATRRWTESIARRLPRLLEEATPWHHRPRA